MKKYYIDKERLDKEIDDAMSKSIGRGYKIQEPVWRALARLSSCLIEETTEGDKVKQEKGGVEKCEECNTELNTWGCMICGEPVCCPRCCKEATYFIENDAKLRNKISTLQSKLDEAVEALEEVFETGDVVSREDIRKTAREALMKQNPDNLHKDILS